MTIWMYVTLDEYELPEAVADTAADLAKMIKGYMFVQKDE